MKKPLITRALCYYKKHLGEVPPGDPNAAIELLEQALALKSREDRLTSLPPAPGEEALAASFTEDGEYIVCLEDGRKMQSLKRHLRAVHGMTGEEYKEKWGLPKSTSLEAPSLIRRRREAAISSNAVPPRPSRRNDDTRKRGS